MTTIDIDTPARPIDALLSVPHAGAATTLASRRPTGPQILSAANFVALPARQYEEYVYLDSLYQWWRRYGGASEH